MWGTLVSLIGVISEQAISEHCDLEDSEWVSPVPCYSQQALVQDT